MKNSSRNSGPMAREKILSIIRSIPTGYVATYGGVAKAAGFPRHARHVAAALRSSFGLPWHRVLGAGGEIKLRGDHAAEQRLRLQAEGVRFRGRRVDLRRHEFRFASPRKQKAQPASRIRKSRKASS